MPVRSIDQLDQPRYRFANRLHVAGVEVKSQGKMTIYRFSKIMLTQFTERLGKVVNHESVMVGEVLDPHLRDFPAGDVEMEAVEKGHILSDHLWKGHE